jgi:putative DNA primase/helicase
MPEVVRAATEAYREEMDVVGQFLEERCTIDPQASISAATLWDEFSLWAAENSEDADRRTFVARLAGRGFEKRKAGHGRVWTWFGIKLKSMGQNENPAVSGVERDTPNPPAKRLN